MEPGLLDNLFGNGDRKSRGSFDQGKPADRGGVGRWLESGEVNSVLRGRLARGMDDRGPAPETPVKGGITLDEPSFAIRSDCDRLNRRPSNDS